MGIRRGKVRPELRGPGHVGMEHRIDQVTNEEKKGESLKRANATEPGSSTKSRMYLPAPACSLESVNRAQSNPQAKGRMPMPFKMSTKLATLRGKLVAKVKVGGIRSLQRDEVDGQTKTNADAQAQESMERDVYVSVGSEYLGAPGATIVLMILESDRDLLERRVSGVRTRSLPLLTAKTPAMTVARSRVAKPPERPSISVVQPSMRAAISRQISRVQSSS